MAHKMDSNFEELDVVLKKIEAQGESNMSQYQKDLLKWTRNVDKRYAWVVLSALFIMMAAVLGPYRVYGLIFARVTQDGVYTREEATWPVSTIFTVENVVGPFVSVIAYHLSYRQSMAIGSLLLILGNGLCSISSSLIVDVILLGVVQGVGYSFIFMPFMEIINNYFLKYRNTALGVALCGGTISVFALSPLFQWVLESYPWRISYLGLGMVCCVNLLMVPLLVPNPKPSYGGEDDSDKISRNTLTRLSMKALSYQNSVRRQSTILISRQSNGIQRQASVISVNPFANSVGLERKISRALYTEPSSSPQMSQEKSKQPNTLSSQLTHPDCANETLSLSEVGQNSEFQLSVIWDILKKPGFHLIWYNELIYFWVFSIYCLILVDYAQDRGCTKDEAENLLSYQSVGEIIGRLVLTVIVDLRFMSNKNTVTTVLVILTTLLIVITQVHGYLLLAVITVTVSAFSSLLYILLNGLLVDYLGETQVTIGYGMASCIGGILMSFRPAAIGFFRDQMGSYDPLMICLGLSCAIGALLWLVEPLLTRCTRSKNDSILPQNTV